MMRQIINYLQAKTILCLMLVSTVALSAVSPTLAVVFFAETFNTDAAADFNDNEAAYAAWNEQSTFV